jgi:tRNA-Thr(GGU) m(6)t(6)A37 methyltransferase TsaA
MIRCRPIGVVHSLFAAQPGTPVQPRFAGSDAVGTVEVLPEYEPGLADLEGFERIWLLCWLDRAGPVRMEVVPYLDTERRGVFATRAPSRPNPIGMSPVWLLDREGATLHVAGLDLLDGTPLLDIKPYVPDLDAAPVERRGWFEAAAGCGVADGRFGGLRAATVRTLAALGAAFDQAGVPYQLGGSGLLFACGLADGVGDLDLQFPADARDRVAAVIERLSGVAPRFTDVATGGFASAWRCRHRIGDQEIDLVGGQAVVVGGRVVPLPVAPEGEWEVAGVAVPLAPAEQSWLVYRVAGKADRAALLEREAGRRAVARFLRRTGVDPGAIP